MNDRGPDDPQQTEPDDGQESEAVLADLARDIAATSTSGGRVDFDDIGQQLLGLGEMLLDETGMDEAVANVLQVGMTTLGDEPAVSVTISQPRDPERRFVTRDATTEWARELDEWQYRNGEGPCLHADKTGETCVVADTSEDERFPAFNAKAREYGVGACVSYPMLVRDLSLGSINVFYAEPGRVRPELIEAGEQLARTAAPLLANWLAHTSVTKLAEQLEQALEGRGVIERAKGLLMGELGIDEDRAFDVLRTQSQHENVKLREIAAQLLEKRRRA